MGQAIAPIYDTEADRIKEQLMLANTLRKQGMSNDIGQGYQGGKVFIVGNPWGKIASTIGGEFIGSRAREDQGAMEQRQQQERDAFLAAMPSATETQHYDPVANPGTGPLVEGMEVPKSPRALEQAMTQWAANAPRGMEGVQNFALQQRMTAPQRQAEQEFRAQEARALAEQRAEAAALAQKEKLESIEREKERDRALRMSMAQFAVANRPAAAPHTQIAYGQDGKGYLVDMTGRGQPQPLENIGKMPAAGGAGGKLPVQAQKVQSSLQNLESGLNAYETLLKDYNPQNADALTPAKRAAIGTAFTDLQMRLKEAYELGAITGPDMSVLQSAITDPTSAWGMLKGGIAGRDTFNAQIGQSKAALNRQKRNFEQQFGVMLPTPAGTATEPMPGAAPSGFKVLGVRDK